MIFNTQHISSSILKTSASACVLFMLVGCVTGQDAAAPTAKPIDAPKMELPKIDMPQIAAPNFQMPVINAAQTSSNTDFFTEKRVHGYRFSDAKIASVPIGASREKVQSLLGSPSTTGTTGNHTYYYISQMKEQTAFLSPKVVDQKVLAVYFDGKSRVSRVANYGIQDGQIFDFVSRTTPTGGDEMTFLRQIFKNLLSDPTNGKP